MQDISIQRLKSNAILWTPAHILIVLMHWFLAFMTYTVPLGKILVLISIFSTLIHFFNIRHLSSVAISINDDEWQIPDKYWIVTNKNNLWDNIKYYFISTHVAIDILIISICLFNFIDLENIKYDQSRPEFMIKFIEYFWLLFCIHLPLFLYFFYTIFIHQMTMKRFFS
jgi:hypothetical protein